jgi:hypothetical protein
MHSNLGVLLAVLHLITGQNPVIADLLEFDLGLMGCPFLEILNFWELGLLMTTLVLSEISAQSCFAHTWETNRYKEKLGDVLHFRVKE